MRIGAERLKIKLIKSQITKPIAKAKNAQRLLFRLSLMMTNTKICVAKKYNIGYVLVSPEERNTLKANEDFFRRYPVVAEAGQFRVYKVTN